MERGIVESGDPLEDSAGFRRCLSQFGTGVAVITASVDEALVGMTANSFTSVSLHPPLVLWSVKRDSQSFSTFARAGHFAVNVLASSQIELSKHFGRSGDDKFRGTHFRSGLGNAPLLDGSIATFECERFADHNGGDHLIILGRVTRYARREGKALLFVQGRYSTASEYPETTGESSAMPRLAPGPMNEFLTAVMYRAHGALSAALDEGRKAEGLSVLQTRLMAAVQTLPGSTLEALLPDLFLGANAAESTLDELIAMGLVRSGPTGELALTEFGQERSRVLLARAKAIEERQLAGIPAEDLAACWRVLSAILSRHDIARRGSSGGGS